MQCVREEIKNYLLLPHLVLKKPWMFNPFTAKLDSSQVFRNKVTVQIIFKISSELLSCKVWNI